MLKADLLALVATQKGDLDRALELSKTRRSIIDDLKVAIERLNWYKDQYHTMWGMYQGIVNGTMIAKATINPLARTETITNHGGMSPETTSQSESLVLLLGRDNQKTQAPEYEKPERSRY